MACEGYVNLEDRLRKCEEEIRLLKSALCEKSESSPQPKEHSTSSPSVTAVSEWRSAGSRLSSPRSESGCPTKQPLAPIVLFCWRMRWLKIRSSWWWGTPWCEAMTSSCSGRLNDVASLYVNRAVGSPIVPRPSGRKDGRTRLRLFIREVTM